MPASPIGRPLTSLDIELSSALRAVEAGFHVRLIATFEPDLVWAPADAVASDWLAENRPAFDQFPVRDVNAVVGLLLRDNRYTTMSVRDAMLPLRDGMIVSADTPITELIPSLCDSTCRLVLQGGRINGLVTQSDLLKLPVRMLLFGLASHLEMCLRAVVRARCPWPNWLERIPRDPRARVRKAYAAASSSRLDPDPLEFTNFSDLIDVLRAETDLGDGFEREMAWLKDFRNDIAHGKTYVESPADVRQLIERFLAIQQWINRLSGFVGTPI